MADILEFPLKFNKPDDKPMMPQIIVKNFDGESAEVKIQYDHIVSAISMYLSTMPFALPTGVDVMDVDFGLEIDQEGYVTMDVYFGKDKNEEEGAE